MYQKLPNSSSYDVNVGDPRAAVGHGRQNGKSGGHKSPRSGSFAPDQVQRTADPYEQLYYEDGKPRRLDSGDLEMIPAPSSTRDWLFLPLIAVGMIAALFVVVHLL